MKKITALFTLLAALVCVAQPQRALAQNQNGAPAQSAVNNTSPVKQKALTQEEIKKIIDDANKGDPKAQLALGSFYATGANGFEKDGTKALIWLTKSAEQNNVSAQVYLGILYATGGSIKPDTNKAVFWRELAATNGDAQEKWSLGNAFLFGYMVPKNLDRAVHWIEAAAELDHPHALVKIVEIYSKSDNAPKLAYWNERFSKLEVSAAENGNVEAMNSIAKKYLKGKGGLPRNMVKGIYWHKQAAEKGNVNSIETLAKMYARGRYLTKNTNRAKEYFMKIVEKDPSYALKISSYYTQGKEGFDKDEEQALFWLERAGERMDDSTRLYIAWRYWSGTNAPKDLQRAVHWCKQCKDMKDSAEKMLKDIYQNKPAPQNISGYIDTQVKLAPSL